MCLPDAVGNLFTTASRTDRRYGPAGQLLEARGVRYAYDEAGNLSQRTLPTGEPWHYSWNAAGHLSEVVRPDGGVVRFTYDALGRRISKSYKGQVTRWVWDGNQPLHEWAELELSGQNTEEVITWLFEPDSFAPLAKLQGADRQSIVCDHLGTPLEMHDGQGQLSWAMELDSYGVVRKQKGEASACPFRYQGQYEDVETGLYYNRFRYYDPHTGQYVSQDPIGLEGGNPTLYGYVHDPTTWLDILGLACTRQIPRMENGNAKEGWQHIDERHVTGNAAKGPGDLFAPGTTRAQLERGANKIVKKGRRVTEDATRRIQTFEKKMVINGRKDVISVTVDSHDGNRIITMFPKISGI